MFLGTKTRLVPKKWQWVDETVIFYFVFMDVHVCTRGSEDNLR